MFTDPRSVVSRSVRPSLVPIVPLRTMEACCEPGSGGWVRAAAGGSLASAAQAGGVSGAKKKRIARTESSATRRATEKGPCWKIAFIVETISGRLLHFTRANLDRKSTRLNSSHLGISYAVFCLKKKKKTIQLKKKIQKNT